MMRTIETNIAKRLWTEAAMEEARAFVSEYGDKPFTTEKLRQWAHEVLPMPRDNRWWGGVVQALRKEGTIKSLGIGHVERVMNANSHTSFATIWIGTQY